MRKIFILIFLVFSLVKINCQTLRQGNVTINGYYGYNVFTKFVRVLAQSSNSGAEAKNIKITSLGPIGITAEGLLNNMVGFGGEIGYSQTKLEYDLEGRDNLGVLNNYNYIWTVSTTRVMGRVNFHFADSPNFDFYPFIAGGFRLSSTNLRTDDPHLPVKLRASFFPIGVKAGLGLRYFFTPNVGLFSEIALGTPIICGGISIKLNNKSSDENK